LRYFIQLSYKGKHYHGWQLQPDAVSVQEKINEALSKIIGKSIATVAAGRTDTGVHASQMFVHVDVENIFTSSMQYYPKTLSSKTFEEFATMPTHVFTLRAEATNTKFTWAEIRFC
jgi:tRNA pseudouridine38-40 synthase